MYVWSWFDRWIGLISEVGGLGLLVQEMGRMNGCISESHYQLDYTYNHIIVTTL